MRKGNVSFISTFSFLSLIAVLLATPATSIADYLKMSPPPDVDKNEHQHGKNPTCWMAASANLLAGAGYGDGNNVQQRADDIYDEMVIHFGANSCGWDDTAANWWLQDANNKWKDTNPYKTVVVYGSRATRYPYARADLPELIGDLVRRCNFLSLSSSEPNCTEGVVGQNGHSTAFWGDNAEDVNDIDYNPSKLKISDSDYWNTGPQVQTYIWDDYNNPVTADCNEGPGWYFNYNDSKKSSRYIDGYVLLKPTEGSTPTTRILSASARFNYNGASNATGLRYKISSNRQLLSYRTSIDWDTNNSPTFTEDTNWVRVEWNLSDHNVPNGSIITATAEIVVPYDDINGNSISIDSALWLPMQMTPSPGASMLGKHNEFAGGAGMPTVTNMCGGYIVGACMIFSNPSGAPPPVCEYRWVLDYDYYQDPCNHLIIFEPNLTGSGGPYYVGYFRFGHSYGFLMDDELQLFSDWKTIVYPTPPFPLLQQMTFPLNWTGQLPYPKGQDVTNPEPNECGDQGTFYLGGDINKDCIVDWQDFALLADSWLGCSEPNQLNCP
jgi:hypothetical protein